MVGDPRTYRVLPKPEPMHAFQSELRTMIQRAAANEEA